MRDKEAQQLEPGTLLAVRECMLEEDPEDDEHYALIDVVGTHGYIYKFKVYLENEHFPIKANSLVTGKHMEFHPVEVEAVKEQDDDIL